MLLLVTSGSSALAFISGLRASSKDRTSAKDVGCVYLKLEKESEPSPIQ